MLKVQTVRCASCATDSLSKVPSAGMSCSVTALLLGTTAMLADQTSSGIKAHRGKRCRSIAACTGTLSPSSAQQTCPVYRWVSVSLCLRFFLPSSQLVLRRSQGAANSRRCWRFVAREVRHVPSSRLPVGTLTSRSFAFLRALPATPLPSKSQDGQAARSCCSRPARSRPYRLYTQVTGSCTLSFPAEHARYQPNSSHFP